MDALKSDRKKQSDAFITCSKCYASWNDREAFLSDPGIDLVGYQAHFKKLVTGYFLFNHSCKTTMALKVSQFTDLYHGPIFMERKTGGDECPGYCLRENCMEACPAECECAYIRHILMLLHKWPKQRP